VNLQMLMSLDQTDYYELTSMPLIHVHVLNYVLLQDLMVVMDHRDVIMDYHEKDLISNLYQNKLINMKTKIYPKED
jgi:hypothetical protein